MNKHDYTVKQIPRVETLDYILTKHYARRVPSISYAFGLFYKEEFVGCITYGSPASPALCKGVCGESYRKQVIELNRLVLLNNKTNEASYLVSRSLKMLGVLTDRIVVSYADSAQDHKGIVYQASNFLFTGTSKKRTDIASEDGKHSRHHLGDRSKRVVRSPKHRYITFVGSRKFKKEARKHLNYTPTQYP